MAELEGTQQVGGEQPAAVQQQQQTPQNAAFEERMAATRRALEGMGVSQNVYDSPDGVEESSFIIEETQQQAQVQQPAQEQVQQPAQEQVQQPAAQEQGQKPETQEQTAEGVKITSAMTGDLNLGPTEEAQQQNVPQNGFESFEDFEKFLAEGDYGITKDNIATKLPELVKASQDLNGVQSTLKNYNTIFENMPPELYNAIVTWGEGGDYLSAINSVPKYDLEKPFEDHGNKAMVDAYFEGKVSNEEWEEFKDPDGDQTVKDKITNLVDIAKEKYTIAQEKFKLEKQTYEQNAQKLSQERQAAFDASRAAFPDKFKDHFPIQDSYITQVDNVAKDRNAVLGLFYNPDGTLKPDAHAKIAMAMGGEELVISQAKALKNRVVSQARQEVIMHTPNSTEIKKSAEANKVTELELAHQKARKRAEELLGKPQKSTYG